MSDVTTLKETSSHSTHLQCRQKHGTYTRHGRCRLNVSKATAWYGHEWNGKGNMYMFALRIDHVGTSSMCLRGQPPQHCRIVAQQCGWRSSNILDADDARLSRCCCRRGEPISPSTPLQQQQSLVRQSCATASSNRVLLVKGPRNTHPRRHIKMLDFGLQSRWLGHFAIAYPPR